MVDDSRTTDFSVLDRPLHVGVVGAGPAGVYVSDTLIRQLRAQGEKLGIGSEVHIDLIERLPVPFGLVRYGVAPDHPAIKWIMAALEKTIAQPQIHLFTNVSVGNRDLSHGDLSNGDFSRTDLSVDDLLEREDLLIFATGAVADRLLRIPGSDSPHVHGAAQLVEWYDGYPHTNSASSSPSASLASAPVFNSSARQVAVIGGGNVAMDITRMMANDPTSLAKTDVPSDVYQTLANSAIQTIHVFVRRGPAQAKFSVQELRQLEKVPGLALRVDPEDFDLDAATLEQARSDHETSQMLDELMVIARRSQADCADRADRGVDSGEVKHDPVRRTVWFHFYSSPEAVVTDPASSAVQALRIRRTIVSPDGQMTLSDQTREIPVQEVYTAIGYQPSAVSGVPYDSDRHVLSNVDGRIVRQRAHHVVQGASSQPSPVPIPREYVTGWAKRGPVGLIGSTKADAKQTVAHIMDDLARDPQHGRNSKVSQALAVGKTVEHLLQSRHALYGTLEGWKRVDVAEQQEGHQHGRSRMVITDWGRLARLADHSRD
jgi:ferredoxin--NADP+ reductase